MHKPHLPRIEIYRQARVILVRQLIDIGRLSITIMGRHIHLKGSLDRLPGVEAPLTPDVVHEMFAAMKRIPGILRVDADFQNWQLAEEAGQVWVETHVRSAVLPGNSGSLANTFVLKQRSDKPPAA